MTAESLEDILKGIGNVVFRPPPPERTMTRRTVPNTIGE